MASSSEFVRAAVVGAVAALSAAFFQAAPARANIVFDFSGDCAGSCSGTATAVLTLASRPRCATWTGVATMFARALQFKGIAELELDVTDRTSVDEVQGAFRRRGRTWRRG
jgi:hypothetical protein